MLCLPINLIDLRQLRIVRHLPLSYCCGACLALSLPNAHAIAMIDAQHHGKDQGQKQSIGGIVAICNIATFEAVVGGAAVQHTSAIGIWASVEHIAPMRPGHC